MTNKAEAEVKVEILPWKQRAAERWPHIPLPDLAEWAKLATAELEIADLRAALKAQPAPTEAQDGWKLVPVELTDDMLIAFAEVWYSKRRAIDDCEMADCYAAMLAAAPEATIAAQRGDNRSAEVLKALMDAPRNIAERAVTAPKGNMAQGEDSARLDAGHVPSMNPACGCEACNPQMIGRMMFICKLCGDKRCPHVANHLSACQGRARASAETGGVK